MWSIRIIFLLLLVGIFGCKKYPKSEGPNLKDQYGAFAISQAFAVSSNSVDFSNQQLYFSAKFTRITDWTITITGSNNAKKIISGKGSEIDNTNSTWNGTTSIMPAFALGTCEAVLFLKADSTFHKLNFQITGKKIPSGQVIANFENGIQAGWKTFVQSGAKMSFVIRDTGVIPEGNKYYDMGGTVNWDWLIGMIEFPASAYGTQGFNLTGNPSDMYFNVVLAQKPGLNNGIVLFQFREDENGDGTFDSNTEDMYSVELKNISNKWNIYSIKYSELLSLVNGSVSTPKGNGRFDMDKLFQISCLMLANPSSGYGQVNMDFIVFTKGKPLEL